MGESLILPLKLRRLNQCTFRTFIKIKVTLPNQQEQYDVKRHLLKLVKNTKGLQRRSQRFYHVEAHQNHWGSESFKIHN